MPLAFESLSHGIVAFGFFNIETDALLLQQHFFFADDFCAAAELVARQGRAELAAWHVERGRVGDLHGAIAGVELDGLIGATYRLWPFPRRAEGFRQQPEGHRNREVVRELLDAHGVHRPLPLAHHGPEVRVGELRFDRAGFVALLAYVERGGYPRWRDEQRPPYVERMVQALAGSPFDCSAHRTAVPLGGPGE